MACIARRLSDVFGRHRNNAQKKKKQALLLYQASLEVREIFRQIPENGNDDFDKAVELLDPVYTVLNPHGNDIKLNRFKIRTQRDTTSTIRD